MRTVAQLTVLASAVCLFAATFHSRTLAAAEAPNAVLLAPAHTNLQVVSTRENRPTRFKAPQLKFPDVYRFVVTKVPQLPSKVGIRGMNKNAAIDAGDELQVTFQARAISSSQPGKKGTVRIECEQYFPKREIRYSETIEVGTEWQTVVKRFRFPEKCGIRQAELTVHTGDILQTIEVTAFEWRKVQ